jgi:hypothetical protein
MRVMGDTPGAGSGSTDPPNVALSVGVPETVLPSPPQDVLAGLAAALSGNGTDQDRRVAVARVVADHPRLVEGWAALGELSSDAIESYAYFRVGYHRGLDALRGSGWRGSGYVRWRHPANQGFLRSVDGLRRQAEVIGEADEATRCADFLRQLDPDWERRAPA